MKYVVQLSYTNPAHEHVSLRRRVDTVNRIVEAANENQAILRASQQQRALGFMIKEAKIVKEKEKMKKKEVVIDDNEKTEVAASGGMKEEAKQVDEGSKRMSAAVKLQRAFDREKAASDASRKRGEEMLAQARAEYAKKQAAKTNEEAEQVDEATKRALNITKADLEVIKSGNHETVKNHMAKMISRATDHKTNARPLRSDKAKEFLDKIHGSTNVGQLQKMAYNIYLGGDDEGKTKYGKLHVYNPQSAKGRDYQKRYGIGEEVEQVDEANMRFDPEAAARPKSSDVKNFLNRDKNARAGAASKKYIRRMTKLGGLGPNQTKKDTEKHMKDYFEDVEISEASKEGKDVMRNMRAWLKSIDVRHGVDSDKRDAGYKMSPAVRKAQAESDRLSKVEKPVQAGTLAALKRRAMKKEEVEYIEEKLSAGDPASKWISDFVASDNPKFAGKTKKERINMALGAYYAAKKGTNEEVEHVEEAADPGKLRVVNKKVEAQASKDTKTSEKKSKATEKAIDVAKSKKNPVNLNPVLTGDKVNNA